MSRECWMIKGSDGKVKASVGKVEYNDEWMQERYVSVTVESPYPIGFRIGDYLEYRGERFEINYDPGKIKSAPRFAKGDAFRYEDVKFNSLADELTRCDFLDVVKGDNQLHFTGLPKFSFYGGVKQLADRIQANLDRAYGKDTWRVEISGEFEDGTELNVSVDAIKVQGALEILVNDFKTYYTIDGRTITIGAAGVPADHLFRYGKGNGLYEIEENAEADQRIVTRLRAYGSTRNIPHRYYNSLSGADGKALIPDNMAVRHLMLPSFPYSTLDPYIDSKNIDALGVREDTIFFDGSGELEEIYPSIEGMTAEQLKEAGISCNAEGALDVLAGAERMTDNGVGTIEGDAFEGSATTTAEPATFKVTLKDIGFDIKEHIIEGNSEPPTLSFKSGMLGGRDFEITGCSRKGDGYELELNRVYDEDIKLWFPYRDYNAAEGDRFVLLNIRMPKVYIKAASQRLLEAAEKHLAKNDYSRSIYNPKIDEIFMARQHDVAMASGGKIKSLHDTLRAGMQLLFEDEDLGIDAAVFIDRLTIVEGEGTIPTYEVTLKEEKTVGALQKMQNQIDSLASGQGQGSGGYNASQIRALIDAYGGTRFLSKIKDDHTPYKLSADQGFEVGEFLAGVAGARLAKDADTGQTFLEVDRIYARVRAYFEQLTTIEASAIAGKQYITPGAGVTCTSVESVVKDGDVTAYRCYFLSEQDGEKREARIMAGDQAIAQTWNAKEGTANKVSNHRWWRFVTAVSNDAYTDDCGNRYGYVEVSATDCEAGSSVPVAGDEIVQLGSRTDPARQAAMVFSTVDSDAPSVKLFTGIGSGTTNTEHYSLAGRDIVSYGFDTLKGNAYFNCYGDHYVGARDASSFIEFNLQENEVQLHNVNISVGSKVGDRPLSSLIETIEETGYLRKALNQSTSILNGLVLTSAVLLGATNALGERETWAGHSGLYTNPKSIASFWGGPMSDRFYDEEGKSRPTPMDLDFAASLVRMDGSAYFASGNVGFEPDGSGWLAGNNIRWDANGAMTFGNGIRIDLGSGGSTTLGGINDTLGNLLTLFNQMQNVLYPVDKDGNRVAWTDRNLYAVKSTKGFCSDEFISARGLNPFEAGGTVGASALADLTDVLLSNPKSGQALVYNGAKWVNQTVSSGLNTTELGQYLTQNEYAKLSDIPSLTGYATQSWAEGKFATKSDLSSHAGNTTVHITADERTKWNATSSNLDTILGSNTDKIINKWDEIVAFLDTYTEADTLANLLSNKADKSQLADYVTLNTVQTITERKTFDCSITVLDMLSLQGGYPCLELYPTNDSYAYGDLSAKSDCLSLFNVQSRKGLSLMNDGRLMYGSNEVLDSGNYTTILDLRYVKKAGDTMTGLLKLNAGAEIKSGQKLTIGDCEITWDADKGGLCFSKGIYSEKWVSARGANANASDVTGGLAWSEIKAELDKNGYATQSWVSGRGFLTSSALTGYATQYWVKNQNYLTSHQSLANYMKFVVNANYVNASFNDASLSQKAADTYIEFWDSPGWWNIRAGKFSVPNGTSAQFLKADGSVDATSYLASSAYTASDILTKLKTIDGSGSGLDADLLDGYHESVFFKTTRGSIPTAFIDITDYNKGAADYANYASGTYSIQRSGYSSVFINFAHNSGGSTSALQLMTNYEDNASLKFRKTIDSNRVSGPWRTILTELNIGSFNAGSATKLQTARTLWGQSFDGTANVSGNMTSVGNITGSAAIVMTANGRLTLNATATAVDLKFNNTDAKSVILNGTAFKPFDAADNALDLGTDVARWKKITACNMRLSSSTSGAGNDVYAELWRGSNASWRMLNTSGVLKFQSNYTDKAGSYFDCFTLAYNTGNAYLKGSLGIGNTAPSYPLDVNGNIRAQSGWFRNTGNNGWYNETYGGGIYMNDSIWIRTYGNKALLVDVSNANAWGIGGHRLNALFQGAAHASILLRVTDNSVAYGIAANTNGNMYFGKRTNGDAYSHTNDAYLMVLNSTGLYIGGGASPAYRLDVNGTARVNSLVIGSCTITYENGGLRFSSGIYSDEFVSARGVNSSGSGSGSGVSYNRLDNWTDYASGKEGYVLSSKLGYDLYSNKADKSALSSYVTLGTAQTIAGAKTFSSSIVCSQGNAGNWWSGTTPRGKFVATNGGNTQGWSPVLGFKTVTGKCEFGSLNDNIHINYYADTVTTNAYTHQLTLPKKTGTLAVTSDITSALASYLPLSGGTLTGVLHLLASQYPDTANTGALNLNNSDIYGVNSIKFADLCDSAAEGLQWYRDSTHIDSFWVKSGVMYFTPNRAWGGTGTDNVVLHSGNYTSYVTKVGTSTVGSASKPIYLSGGTPTASSSTIGSASVPVFLSSGTITKCTASSIFSSLTTSDKSISITIAGQTRTLTVPYASSAGKLSSSHTIWGQKFNGSSGVEGELSNVSGINFTSSGAFKIDKYGNLVATTSSTNTWNVYKSDASTKILSLMCDASVGFVKVTNFGIGTASPSYKLDVNGTARAKKLIADTIYTDGQIQVGANGEKFLVDETGYVTVGDYLEVKGGAIFFGDMMIDQMVNDIEIYNPKSGKLYYNGICDFTGLEVSGDTNLTKLAVNTEQFVVSGNSVSIGTSYTLANNLLLRKNLVVSNVSVFFTSTTNGTGEGLWFTPEGTYNNKKYLGLMKHTNRSWTADCCRFFFDGTFWAKTGIYSDGYVSARGQNTSSDERLKQGFTPFEIALRQIAGAPSVGFSWKKDGSRDVGSIAQYWKGINPLLTPEDNDGFLTLQYGKTALLASITIAREVVSHEERIARLERENKELKRKIEILERR